MLYPGMPVPAAAPSTAEHKDFKIWQSGVSSEEWRRSIYTEYVSTWCGVFSTSICK